MATIQDMEDLTSNAAAQTAYVTNSGYTADLTATMLANDNPSPNVVSADSEDTTLYAFLAFDDNEANWWLSANTDVAHWIKYYFGSGNGKIVNKLRIKATLISAGQYGLKDFTFQGSNNDADWDVLLTDQQENNADWQEYTFTNNTSYTYYKIVSTTFWHATYKYISIKEIEMMITALQPYSEATIKTQGSYSLKVTAAATTSLNKTLTKTF